MFLKAIGIKVLVLSISMGSLILAGERFEVHNMGITDICGYAPENTKNTIKVFLKENENHPIWITTSDYFVKSYNTDENKPNILHLEFDNGEKCSVDMTEALQKFY